MTHSSPYVITIGIIAIFFILDRVLKFLRREPRQSFFKLVSIIFIWIVVIMIIAFPVSVKKVLRMVGADTDLNTLVFIGFLFVILAFLRLLGIIEKLERDITHIVREEAIRDFRHSLQVRKKRYES